MYSKHGHVVEPFSNVELSTISLRLCIGRRQEGSGTLKARYLSIIESSSLRNTITDKRTFNESPAYSENFACCPVASSTTIDRSIDRSIVWMEDASLIAVIVIGCIVGVFALVLCRCCCMEKVSPAIGLMRASVLTN